MLNSNIKRRLNEVIVIDATKVNKVEFLATHLPFSKLKYTNSGENIDITDTYYEEEFFRKFNDDSEDQHTFMVVQGDSGSGKSHFIKWMKYRYESEINGESEICVMVERSNNTLQRAIKQIVECNEIKEFIDESEKKKLLDANTNLSSDKLKYMIINNFITEIQSEDDEDCSFKTAERKAITAFFQDNNVQETLLLRKGGPIERIKERVNDSNKLEIQNDEAIFLLSDLECSYDSELSKKIQEEASREAEKCFVKLCDKQKFKIEALEYLNSKIDIVIQSCMKLNAQDFTEIFMNLRKKMFQKNKRLTLFIEDLTSFVGIDKALVEILITEHRMDEDNDICRIKSIVGVTNTYYNSYFPSNIRSRITSRVIIDKESIFENDNKVVEIAARYLNALYIDRNKLQGWAEDGGLEQDIPLADKYSELKWASTEINSRDFTIFPFNKRALINLFNALEDKTPRSLLKEVIKNVVPLYFENKVNFPISDTKFGDKIKVPAWKKATYEKRVNSQVMGNEFDRLSCFMRVWGDGTADSTMLNGEKTLAGLTADVYAYFGLPFISGFEMGNSNVLGSKSELNIKTQTTKNILTESNTVNTTKFELMKDIKTEKFDKNKLKLKNWCDGKKSLQDHSFYRDEICRILKNSINWDIEEVSDIYIQSSLTRENIHIEGQNVLGKKGIVFKRNKETQYLLEAISAWREIGDRKWGFAGSTEYISIIMNWVIKHKDRVVEMLKQQDIGESIEYSSSELAIYNDYLVGFINGSIKKNSDVMEIYKAIMKQNLSVDGKRVKRLGKSEMLINDKIEDIRSNHEITIRGNNCILGEANSNTTPAFFIDAYEIIHIIEKFKKNKFEINELERIKEVSSKQYIPYNLNVKLWEKIIFKVIDSILIVTDSYVNKIGELLEYDGSAESKRDIERLFIEFKDFLETKIKNINEMYDSRFEEIVNEKITGKKVIHSILEHKESLDTDRFAKLRYVLSSKIGKIENYNIIIKYMDKYIDNTYKRFEKSIIELDETEAELTVAQEDNQKYTYEITKLLKDS